MSPRTIDVHAHCVPNDVIDTLRAHDGRFGIEITEHDGRYAALIAGRVQTRPMFPAISDLPRRLAAMDTAGVDMQVLSSWIDLTAYALPADAGARYARMFNESLAATVASSPDRFVAVATVPLQQPEAAAAELRHAVGTLGLVGVEIATTVDGVELDDPGLDPFWAAAEELRCLVIVHPYASLAGRGVQRYNLGNLIGNPAESTIAVGHLIFGGVLEPAPGSAALHRARRRLRAVPDRAVGPWLPHERRGARGSTSRDHRATGCASSTSTRSCTRRSRCATLIDPVGDRARSWLGSDYPLHDGATRSRSRWWTQSPG